MSYRQSRKQLRFAVSPFGRLSGHHRSYSDDGYNRVPDFIGFNILFTYHSFIYGSYCRSMAGLVTGASAIDLSLSVRRASGRDSARCSASTWNG